MHIAGRGLALIGLTLVAACGSSPASVASGPVGPSSSVGSGSTAVASTTPAPPSVAASPQSATISFVSARYGYTVEIPRLWRQMPATTDWNGTARLTDLSTSLDRFDDNPAPGALGHFLGIASQAVDGASWLDSYTSANPKKFDDVCPDDPHAWAHATVKDDPAVTFILTCPDAVVEYVFVHGRRAWIVSGDPEVVDGALRTLVLPS